MNQQVLRETRARFSVAQLKAYEGQWVAFSLDGRRTIANSDDLAALDKLILDAAENPEQVALERIELDDVSLGGAELA